MGFRKFFVFVRAACLLGALGGLSGCLNSASDPASELKSFSADELALVAAVASPVPVVTPSPSPSPSSSFSISSVSSSSQSSSSTPSLSVGQIRILPEQVMNAVSTGSAYNLIDGNTATGWTMTNPWLVPYQKAVIDLRGEYRLSRIDIYRKNTFSNMVPITIRACVKKSWAVAQAEASKSNPLACTDLVSETLNGPAVLLNRPVSARATHVEIQFGIKSEYVGEVTFFGTPLGTLSSTVKVIPPITYPEMGSFIGVNGFNNDPVAQVAPAAGNFRDYVNKSWLTGGDVNPTRPGDGYLKNDSVTFEPATGGFRFDRFYSGLNGLGVEPYTTLKEAFRGGFTSSRDSVNVPGYDGLGGGEDPFNPNSYRATGDLFFQFAARYGSRVVPDSLLKLRSDQPRLTGANYIKVVETENEQDKTWKGFKAWHHPYMDAAYSSALFDGHMNTIRDPGVPGQNTIGVKNADPNMKLSMGGIFAVESATGSGFPDLAISRAQMFKLWFDVYRNGSPNIDIINVHNYFRAGTPQTGVPPEQHHVKEFAENLVNFSRNNMNGMPVWFTEFGWDSNPLSHQAAVAYGPYSQGEVHGMWLVRTYLILSSVGVQRATMYMFRDAGTSSTNYSTSGLVGRLEDGFTPVKESWYMLATFKNIMKGTRFVSEVRTGSQVKDFIYQGGGKTIHVIWMPTADGSVSSYDPGVGSANIIRFSSQSTTGVTSGYSGGPIQITEMPIFVVK